MIVQERKDRRSCGVVSVECKDQNQTKSLLCFSQNTHLRALVAFVLSTALEEHMPLERVFARESSATLANIRFCVIVDVLVPF